jgi:hypothetical protein
LVSERKDGKWVYFSLTDAENTRSWMSAALSPLTGDQQLEADNGLVRELRSLPVEDLCRFGYEAARAKALSFEAGAVTPRKARTASCRIPMALPPAST